MIVFTVPSRVASSFVRCTLIIASDCCLSVRPSVRPRQLTNLTRFHSPSSFRPFPSNSVSQFGRPEHRKNKLSLAAKWL